MIIIKIGMCLSYFMLAGLSTTNILRLLRGSVLPVLSSECHCDHCGMKISPLNQLPIVSYIACKGHCKQCGIKLPLDALLLEIAVFVGMTLISVIGNFSLMSVVCGFLYYEVIRVICIVRYGKRENGFAKQYIFALLAMVSFFVLIGFMSLLLYTPPAATA